MSESNGRRICRVAWGVVLTLVAPGLGLVFARAWSAGIVLLVLDEALSLSMLWLTREYAPERWTFLALLGLFVAAILLRAGALFAVVRRAWRERPAARWFRTTWLAALVLGGVMLAAGLALPEPGWRSFSVPSSSMVPTLLVGDLFLADVRTPGTRPAAGDVMVFAAPDPGGTVYVKRVVGLPGDRVSVRFGHLTVNGRPTGLRSDGVAATADGEARRYLETLPSGRAFRIQKLRDDGPMNDTPDFIVPPGNLFVMGDNRDNSLDSRTLARGGGSFGYVPFPNLIGPARLVFWPPFGLRPVE